MQTVKRVISHYRRRRLIISISIVLLVFFLTMAVKFFAERQLNQHRISQFSKRAVYTVEALISPFNREFSDALPLMSLPCENAQQTLREHATKLPMIQSISLVKNGVIYCSNVFGTTHHNVSNIHPRLPTSTALLLLSTDTLINKNSPILISWLPIPPNTGDGVMQVINLGILAGFIQYADGSWVDKTILNIAGAHFQYSQGLVPNIAISTHQVRQEVASKKFPFSITTVGPSSEKQALGTLVSQLPLAIILSLLCGACTWFMTAKRLSFFREIHLGLAEREFEVYCQPLIDANNQQCVGIELLVRWNNPRQGNISPSGFIPLAEEFDLIAPLTCFVLQETVKYLHQLPKNHDFHISINVAARHFKDGAIIEDLRRYWFPANPQQSLILELTERDPLPEMSYQIVRNLHHLGIKLAIDDFGTGQSSLAYMETLRPDILKIDKKFTAAIGTDAINSTVIDIIIALGHRLNIELIAEGVETQEQADFLRQQHVNLLQGYFYAKPMPLAQFPDWLESHKIEISNQPAIAQC